MKPLYRVLRDARELIKDPSKWHQGALLSNDGTKMCLVAAIRMVDHGSIMTSTALSYRAEMLVSRIVKARLLGEWNDTHTHREVIDAIGKAMRKAR